MDRGPQKLAVRTQSRFRSTERGDMCSQRRPFDLGDAAESPILSFRASRALSRALPRARSATQSPSPSEGLTCRARAPFDDRVRQRRDHPTRKRPSLVADERGLASVEYVILLVTVTLGSALLIAAIGPTLIRAFEWQVAVLGLPVP